MESREEVRCWVEKAVIRVLNEFLARCSDDLEVLNADPARAWLMT